MHTKLKITLTALAVSVALAGCKSTEGSHVVADKKEEIQAVKKTEETANDTSSSEKKSRNPKPTNNTKPQPTSPVVDTAQPSKPSEPVKTVAPESQADEDVADVQPTPPVSQPAKPILNKPTEIIEDSVKTENVRPVNEDKSGKHWRVMPLSDGGLLANAGDARRESRDHFMLPEDEEHLSPFKANEDDKAYNYYLTLDLGTNEQSMANTKKLQRGDNYLGQHSGQFKDLKLEGETIIAVHDDGDVDASKADTVRYIYVNQPYSSYGAFYTNENDSNLFHIHLSTGRDGKKKAENGSGSTYAEYGVFDIINGKAKWNDNLIGDATYKGEVIARVEYIDGDKISAEIPKVDGDVTLTLHLDNDWDKNKLVGHINSQTLGKITLDESGLPESHAKISRSFISFNGEAIVDTHPNLEGNYYTQFAGENLNDVVGKVELESDVDKGISRYNAVFGATKQK